MRQSRTRRLALRDIMWRGERVAPPAAVQMVVSSMRCPIEGRVIAALRANTAAIEGLDAVHTPTLIAWPQHDRILPMARHAERFRTEIADAEFTMLEGVGHVPMWDAPLLVVKTIDDFVTRQLAAASPTA